MTDTITVLGNIASPPEPGCTPTGVETLTFRLASNLRRQDPKTGVWSDVGTNWYTVHAYRKLAENAGASLGKGDSVIVTGRLKLREWTTKEGKHGLAVEIEADSIGGDLRWGRGTYHRMSAASASEPGRETGQTEDAATRAESERVPAGGAAPSVTDDWAVAEQGERPF